MVFSLVIKGGAVVTQSNLYDVVLFTLGDECLKSANQIGVLLFTFYITFLYIYDYDTFYSNHIDVRQSR